MRIKAWPPLSVTFREQISSNFDDTHHSYRFNGVNFYGKSSVCELCKSGDDTIVTCGVLLIVMDELNRLIKAAHKSSHHHKPCHLTSLLRLKDTPLKCKRFVLFSFMFSKTAGMLTTSTWNFLFQYQTSGPASVTSQENWTSHRLRSWFWSSWSLWIVRVLWVIIINALEELTVHLHTKDWTSTNASKRIQHKSSWAWKENDIVQQKCVLLYKDGTQIGFSTMSNHHNLFGAKHVLGTNPLIKLLLGQVSQFNSSGF